MLVAAPEIVNDQTRTAVLARQHDEEIAEQRRVGEEAAVAMGNNVAPVRLVRRVARRNHDLEVARLRIGADIEAVAVIHHVVKQPRPARRDQQRLCGRTIEIDHMRLRGVMPVHDDQGRPAEPRRGETDEPGGVGLGEDFDVLALGGSQAMQHHPERTMMLVLLDIEERRGIARPDQVVGGVDDADREGPRRVRRRARESSSSRSRVRRSPRRISRDPANVTRRRNRRTACLRRARRRQAESSPRRLRGACGNRSGAGRPGESASNRPMARRLAAARCRLP